MFKRRPLRTGSAPVSGSGHNQATGGKPPPSSPEPKPRRPSQGASGIAGGQAPPTTPTGSQGGRRRHRGKGGSGAHAAQPNQQGQPQNQQKKQNQGGGRRQRNQARRRKPAQPQHPAYIQRDLLLVAFGEATKGIEEVRQKFDPLAKKIPAHVTLLFPEHEGIISREFLKSFQQVPDLPELKSLVFSSVQVRDEMYLWLIPDHESTERIKAWHEALVQKLEAHTQEKVYEPHITLGYIPRSQTSEQAIEFARGLISLPLRLDFEKIMLEEFSENQNSTAIDTLKFDSVSVSVSETTTLSN